ncbi:hypothetical protein MBOE_24560 [Mycolicibacterium boenickei]|uniref:Uncharacterized protein n=1 Tax=Mycolicibacterium boenickei TaxID=146017 RepID=A0ABN5Z9D0_9MYCO|nr:hypothetical protein MBOE_24560 [Mycolicibacterium boenickei]
MVGRAFGDEIIQLVELPGGEDLPYASRNRLVLIIGHDSDLSWGYGTAEYVRTENGRTAGGDATDASQRVLPQGITRRRAGGG